MKTRMLWPLALVVFLAGCGAEVVVESNTSWMGNVCDAEYCAAEYADHDLRGSGDKSFPQFPQDGDRICYWFGNTTDSGYVRVYINDQSVFGSSRYAEHETSVSHGFVSGCWTQ